MATGREELPLGRLEAFSDGVFASAITLIVLELGVSSDAAEHLPSTGIPARTLSRLLWRRS